MIVMNLLKSRAARGAYTESTRVRAVRRTDVRRASSVSSLRDVPLECSPRMSDTGTSTLPRIRLARPALDARELAVIGSVLESGMLVSGARVERFEQVVRERVGRAHAIAVANGTAALELAMRALDLGGHEVLVPALTWPSPAHAAALSGAKVALIDVDPSEWNLAVASTLARIRPETRAIVAIDQFGVPARVRELEAGLAARGRSDVVVIEDAACAIGSTLRDAGGGERACGAFGVVSTLSFHPRKVVTTGEGGMILTDDASLAARLRTLRNHGQREVGVFVEAGPNQRLTEMQAAMGLVQIEKLDEILARRRAIAARYREGLADLPLALQAHPEGSVVNEQTFGASLTRGDTHTRDRLVSLASEANVELGKLSYDLTSLASLDRFAPHEDAPVTRDRVARGFALPLHTAMSDSDVERVLATVRASTERALT
ncbi:MAG: DegT/DnrJ/EryC1/StrS family aminotransferase [Deltaproteobacteria bacterium]|nr:DegT/DnrJ/EryC1/StrS family aminotransferase [Deltaproteobacteria bacterium]